MTPSAQKPKPLPTQQEATDRLVIMFSEKITELETKVASLERRLAGAQEEEKKKWMPDHLIAAWLANSYPSIYELATQETSLIGKQP